MPERGFINANIQPEKSNPKQKVARIFARPQKQIVAEAKIPILEIIKEEIKVADETNDSAKNNKKKRLADQEKKEIEGIFDDLKVLEEIYLEAEKVIGEDKTDYEKFFRTGIRIEHDVKNDLKYIKRIENNIFSDEQSKKSAIMEAVVTLGAKKLNWFGNLVEMDAASRLDNITGTDILLKIKLSEEKYDFLFGGIDITIRNPQKKFFSIKAVKLLEKIKKGSLGIIAYYQDKRGKCFPELKVPMIIIAFDEETVKELAYLFKDMNDPEKENRLINHRAKQVVINQILGECDLLSGYAERCGQKTMVIAYKNLKNAILQTARRSPELKDLVAYYTPDVPSRTLDVLKTLIEKQEKGLNGDILEMIKEKKSRNKNNAN